MADARTRPPRRGAPVLRPRAMTAPLAPRDRMIALAALVLGGVAIGAAPIFVRLAEDDGVGSSAIAFWRLAFAFPLLALWAALEPRAAAPASDGREGRLLLLTGLAGFCFAADLVTWHAGIVRTSAANATLFANLTPVIVALAAWVIFKERPSGAFLAALAATLLGATLLSGGGFTHETGEAPNRALGDLLSALTAFWYAGYMLAVKAVRASRSTGWVMAATTVVGLPITLGAALLFGDALLPRSPLGWLWLAGLGLVCQIAGQGGIAYGLGRLPAALSAIVVLVQPVVAAAIAWVLFDEALGALELAGGALVVAGVVLAQRQGRAPRPG